MNNWLNHQLQAIKLVLSRMHANSLSSSMISLVIGVAMCLPSLFYIGVDNLSKLTDHMQNETEISLFLKLDVSHDTISEIDALLAKNPEIKQYYLVTKDEAWQQLQAKSKSNPDVNDAVNQLGKNPLPDAFFIQAKSVEPDDLASLKTSLQSIPGVEQALLNTDWAKRLSTMISLSKKLIFFIAALLAIVLLVIIGNTVRMQILTQQDEIEVSYLIGATNSFIRTPFLYAGVFYGLFGGLFAVLMILGITLTFNYAIADLSSLYNSDFSLTIFNGSLFLTVVSTAVLIGWLGSYLAVTRAIASVIQLQKNH
ncbi:MAG: permease-like cell division protein FtsX [Methylotenera sp.]|nr:permease-like cell division protein FtsX [Methylotenera sp.]MDP1754700.1 permease-like cell division protein FtsX [Methylotenera sp.]MDP1958738.1 permease-like cell division protein FtsX [Methylotenera sp.]MDP3207205.1 permease-like cell division protein FtsX [Methylotenera sp.]MDP3303650.1 permease-like cell division protein FtsX [Methylotenera sp.]